MDSISKMPLNSNSSGSIKNNIKNLKAIHEKNSNVTPKTSIPNDPSPLASNIKSINNKQPFKTKSFKQFIEACKAEPKPKKLMGDLIYENEQIVMFSPTGLGKTILAMQIAIASAKGIDLDLGNDVILKNEIGKVTTVYFDFELSNAQLYSRIGNKSIPENLFISKVDRGKYLKGNPQEIFDLIKIEAQNVNAKFIIIDNMSKIGYDLEKGQNAINFMEPLFNIVRHEGYTVLIVAHTPKIDRTLPLTTDSLGGSSKIAQLADAIIGINSVNSKDENKVYIKQLKTRNDAIIYGKNNVICTTILKDAEGFVKHCCYNLCSEYKALNEYKIKEPNYENKLLAACYYIFYGSYGKANDATGISESTIKQRVRYFKRDYPDEYKKLEKESQKEIQNQIIALKQ
ncbi:AAA family ATPase [Aestuariivivens marinum]|uniref:AAA family ATPase n=1 Tax=Aestuariivivens marinum TaxID=2913555 RepID=UPI001F58E0A4|nr:AAA family ATPase [Aestuariivivens marinum]